MKPSLIFAVVGFLLEGCMTSGPPLRLVGANQINIIDGFKNGDIRLECSLPCSGRWGWNRNQLKSFYTAGLWRELANRVIEIGYHDDLAYFYLGRAAEEMGFSAAAEKYYRLSIASPIRCNLGLAVCDGFVLPQEAEVRLANLTNPPAQLELNKPQTAPALLDQIPGKRDDVKRNEKRDKPVKAHKRPKKASTKDFKKKHRERKKTLPPPLHLSAAFSLQKSIENGGV